MHGPLNFHIIYAKEIQVAYGQMMHKVPVSILCRLSDISLIVCISVCSFSNTCVRTYLDRETVHMTCCDVDRASADFDCEFVLQSFLLIVC